jgi:1,4-alpha-glucan branching enzyme
MVYGKKSILGRMPGMNGSLQLTTAICIICLHIQEQNYCLWDKFGQSAEWNFERSLDWHLNEYPYHDGQGKLITDLNGCIQGAGII